MGRPRTFDEPDVLRRATAFFGHRGFDAVPVDAVLTELGMNRASFYKLFGSKQGLVRAALEHVCERARAGDIDESSRDLTVVALLELAGLSVDMRNLTFRAAELCFSNDPSSIGQHMLNRAHRPTV